MSMVGLNVVEFVFYWVFLLVSLLIGVAYSYSLCHEIIVI